MSVTKSTTPQQPSTQLLNRCWKYCVVCDLHRFSTKTTSCKHNVKYVGNNFGNNVEDNKNTQQVNKNNVVYIKNSTLCGCLTYIEDSAYNRGYIASRDNHHKQPSILTHPHPTNVLLVHPTTMRTAGYKLLQLLVIEIAANGNNSSQHLELQQQLFQQYFSHLQHQQQKSSPHHQQHPLPTPHRQQQPPTHKHTYYIIPDSTLPLDTIATQDTTLQHYSNLFCSLNPINMTHFLSAKECHFEILSSHERKQEDEDEDEEDEYDYDLIHTILKDAKNECYVFESQVMVVIQDIHLKVSLVKSFEDDDNDERNNNVNNNNKNVDNNNKNNNLNIYYKITNKTHIRIHKKHETNNINIKNNIRNYKNNNINNNPNNTYNNNHNSPININNNPNTHNININNNNDIVKPIEVDALSDYDWMGRGVGLMKMMVETWMLSQHPSLEMYLPKSLLLHGSPGSGKKGLVKSVCQEYKLKMLNTCMEKLFSLDTDEFKSNMINLSKQIEITFHQPSTYQPITTNQPTTTNQPITTNQPTLTNQPITTNQATLIFINSLHSLPTSTTSSSSNNNHAYIFNDHLSKLLKKHHDLIIIGSSNKPDLVNTQLTQKGSGVFALSVGIPDPDEITKKKILARSLGSKVVDGMTSMTKGHSLIDLQNVILKAKMAAMFEGVELSTPLLNDVIKTTPPSCMRDVVVQNPGVRYDDIGGRQELKRLLKQCIQLSIHHPHLLSSTNLSAPKGVLLFGPPGCSKTMLAKAVASESGLNFIAVQGTSLHRMYVGETEAAIRDIFNKARSSPSVVFFDEVDAFAGKRGSDNSADVQDRVLQQLLTEVDGCNKLYNVFIMAATNRPDLIDKAFIRPGRFDRCVYVPLPEAETRRKILHKRLKGFGCDIVDSVCGGSVRSGDNGGGMRDGCGGDGGDVRSGGVSDGGGDGRGDGGTGGFESRRNVVMEEGVDDMKVNIDVLVVHTEGLSCAEVASIPDEAWMLAMERDDCDPQLTFSDLLKISKETRPSVSQKMVRWYESYNEKFSH